MAILQSIYGNINLVRRLFFSRWHYSKSSSNITRQTQKRNLDFLINPSFQGVNRLLGFRFCKRNS